MRHFQYGRKVARGKWWARQGHTSHQKSLYQLGLSHRAWETHALLSVLCNRKRRRQIRFLPDSEGTTRLRYSNSTAAIPILDPINHDQSP